MREAGFDARGARDATTAFGHLDDGWRPDVVFSDFRLGCNETGIDVVAGIRRIVGRDVPAVIATGDTTRNEIENANLVECTVLYKPVDIDGLLNLLGNHGRTRAPGV